MKLYGHEWNKDDLLRHSGRIEQLAGITRYELQEGFERGVEICEVRTGSGFRFLVCPSRGLDIVYAEHNGRPLCWNSSTGILHPAYFSEYNFGWLRGFYGGLLTTCGLSNFSAGCEDNGEHFGIHDRISYIPATEVRTDTTWPDDSTLELTVSGSLRQTRVFGPNLKVERRISARGGENTLTVSDRVINEGYEPASLVLLYHCNFGFPVISEDSTIQAPSTKCEPADDFAASTVDSWHQLEKPQPGLAERCYFHTMQPDESGFVRAEIWNKKLNFGGFVRYRFDTLPNFTQWKMMGAGTYVCGLEPSNTPLMPRTKLQAIDALPTLQPGESREFLVELGVVEVQN